ncbi:acyl-CoA desaturase [Aplysia californica]|uniref:Acyl-CoA desaturase n=1 Tax=Aplysia californica TaxID=6500 RepID=A0ABM1W3S7_APLCA|nr:acyl-CoA desaturase [Aplysia californica]XP_005112311.1 acyl-CoA desaturase [Aplysia californica]XP_035829320.1 acyl-CoA desaturase [Aplysia californica]
MPPRNKTETQDYEGDILGLDQVEMIPPDPAHAQKRPPTVIVWRNVILFILLHIGAFYALFLLPKTMYQTFIWTVLIFWLAAQGVTAGAHRLWAHRSYKARLPLRIFLGMCNSISFENSILEWSRDHRAHHKFSETDADPHNAKRGFVFSHIGWLCVKKHPDVKEKGKMIDLSDLKNDPVVAFQDRHYMKLVLVFCFILPTCVPAVFWGESLFNAFYICTLLRYTLVLNATWLVNSAAHMWGNRPYDERINPAENFAVALCASGEGFHNYHHVFPHDYSTSEFGWHLNITTLFIDFMYLVGQAYDLRKIPKDVILRRKLRTGDGSKH